MMSVWIKLENIHIMMLEKGHDYCWMTCSFMQLAKRQFEMKKKLMVIKHILHQNGNNHIQKVHLGRYIVG